MIRETDAQRAERLGKELEDLRQRIARYRDYMVFDRGEEEAVRVSLTRILNGQEWVDDALERQAAFEQLKKELR